MPIRRPVKSVGKVLRNPHFYIWVTFISVVFGAIGYGVDYGLSITHKSTPHLIFSVWIFIEIFMWGIILSCVVFSSSKSIRNRIIYGHQRPLLRSSVSTENTFLRIFFFCFSVNCWWKRLIALIGNSLLVPAPAIIVILGFTCAGVRGVNSESVCSVTNAYASAAVCMAWRTVLLASIYTMNYIGAHNSQQPEFEKIPNTDGGEGVFGEVYGSAPLPSLTAETASGDVTDDHQALNRRRRLRGEKSTSAVNNEEGQGASASRVGAASAPLEAQDLDNDHSGDDSKRSNNDNNDNKELGDLGEEKTLCSCQYCGVENKSATQIGCAACHLSGADAFSTRKNGHLPPSDTTLGPPLSVEEKIKPKGEILSWTPIIVEGVPVSTCPSIHDVCDRNKADAHDEEGHVRIRPASSANSVRKECLDREIGKGEYSDVDEETTRSALDNTMDAGSKSYRRHHYSHHYCCSDQLCYDADIAETTDMSMCTLIFNHSNAQDETQSEITHRSCPDFPEIND